MAAPMASLTLEEIVLKLVEVGGLKFGNFTMRTGEQTPVYIDMRVICSYPQLMASVSEHLWLESQRINSQHVLVCGVPYTALPLASYICAVHDVPMLVKRKEQKDYGTKKTIEGHYKQGDHLLLVDDVVMTGGALLETIHYFKGEGFSLTDTVAFFDREQGGCERIKTLTGVSVHCCLTISKAFEVLKKANRIDQNIIDTTMDYIKRNRFDGPAYLKRPIDNDSNCEDKVAKKGKMVLSHSARGDLCKHPLAKKLFAIMDEKQTNLAFSVDVTSSQEILKLAEEVGPYICILKTHVDIIRDFSEEFTSKLAKLAVKHNFLLFEDRKFGDICHTVKEQYRGGMYRIADWAHIINAHSVPGTGVIQGLKEVGASKDRACLLVAEMSCEGTLAKGDYAITSMNMAEQHRDFVIGFVCQSQISSDPTFIHMTPGVSFKNDAKDGFGQHYSTPEDVIGQRDCDVIIVGRGILQADNPAQEAKKYAEAGYQAYLRNVK